MTDYQDRGGAVVLIERSGDEGDQPNGLAAAECRCWHECAADMRRAIMAQTTKKTAKASAARTRAPAKKAAKVPAARTRTPAKKGAKAPRSAAQRKAAIDRTAQMSDDVLKSVEAGQRAAIDAVRKFVDTVDEALPALGGHPSRREAVIDAALEMADRLVTTQYDFLRSVVRSADLRLTQTSAPKK